MYVPAGLILNCSVCLKYTTITTTTVCGGGTQPAPELVDCPLGTGTITGEFSAYDPASCVVLPCNPCGSTTPDLYLTSKLSVYKQPAWAPGLPLDTDTAELQCTLDQTDTFICQVTSSCTLNDIAIDNQVRGSERAPSKAKGRANRLKRTNHHKHTYIHIPQGNYILLGRRKDSGTGTGWVIKVDPKDIVPGEPCPYTVLLGELQQPWAGLGACMFALVVCGISHGQTNCGIAPYPYLYTYTTAECHGRCGAQEQPVLWDRCWLRLHGAGDGGLGPDHRPGD